MNEEVRSILQESPIGVLATINDDGTPWTTPLHLMFDDHFIYWISPETTRHSRNITFRPAVSLSAWPLNESNGLFTVFINSRAEKISDADNLMVHNKFRERFGAVPSSLESAAAYRMPIGHIDYRKTSGSCFYINSDVEAQP